MFDLGSWLAGLPAPGGGRLNARSCILQVLSQLSLIFEGIEKSGAQLYSLVGRIQRSRLGREIHATTARKLILAQ